MSLRDDVRIVLNRLTEGTGVAEEPGDDFSVLLNDMAIWVRVHGSPAAVSVYREVADDVPRSPELDERLHDQNAHAVVFRAFWENERVFLRADVPADPFVPSGLQCVLEAFDAAATDLQAAMQTWMSPPGGLAFTGLAESSQILDDSAITSTHQGGAVGTDMTFALVITINGKAQQFVLGLSEVQMMVDGLPGDSQTFAGVFVAASAHPAAAVRASAARKECLPADAAMELAADPSTSVRRAVVYSPVFRRVANDALILRMIASDPEVAEAVADLVGGFEVGNPEVVGAAILRHPDPNVRLKMAEGYSTPNSLLAKLCQDSVPAVARMAKGNIEARFS